MQSRCPRAFLIAPLAGLLIAFGVVPDAGAQSMNFEKYCKDVYGEPSRAVLPDEHDANSWRCSKGNETVVVDVNDVCHRQYGPTRVAVLGNASDPKSWTCVGRDNPLSGVVPPERVAADVERDAKKMQDEGKSTAFCRRLYFFFAANAGEFSALAKNTVFLISVWTHKPEELPIQRAYVRANGQDIPVMRVAAVQSEQDANSIAAQVCGPHRDDGIYLVPTGAMLRDGVLMLDFAANRPAYNLLKLPSRVALDHAEKNAMFKSPDPPPNARPDLKAVQAFVGRKFPGYPVPKTLPR